MLLKYLITLLSTACCVFSARHFLHMLQLESYQLEGFGHYLGRNRERILLGNVAVGVGFTVLRYLMGYFLQPVTESDPGKRELLAGLITIILFILVALFQAYRRFSEPAKKKLVMTKRAKRLGTAIVLVCLLACVVLTLLGVPACLAYAAVPYLVYLAQICEAPLEKRINAGFFNAAKAKLAERNDLLCIGITGSYGKTSTKFALRDILSVKYRVLATPSSFNTPMGVSTVINRDLKPEHQIFIAEMGARHVGEIRELCDLVHPTYGVITSIGPQHLETFGSIGNVASTKFELIESLPKDGIGFFASDGDLCDRLWQKCDKEKYRVAFDDVHKPYMSVTDLRADAEGSHFTLTCADGTWTRCHTKLLGRHNVQDIALAAAVARRIGLTMEEISRGIRRIQPVEHRKQLIPGVMTVIDDAFNSNPSGAEEALNVLSFFPGQRIIVTPGMVEQGDREEELNYRFGTQMKDKADVAILVGKRHTRPIREGLTESGFRPDRIYVCADLNEATELLRSIGKPGDTVLFENDLPDNYNE